MEAIEPSGFIVASTTYGADLCPRSQRAYDPPVGEGKRLTRRELLAGLAGAGAAAWVAPVLTSTPAVASTSVNPCEAFTWSCGSTPPPMCCGERGWCFPKVNAEGKHHPFKLFCGDFESNESCSGHPTCTVGGDNSECPPGYRCFSTCCDQYFNLPLVCLKKCRKPAKGPVRAIQRTVGPSLISR
jgi:hypothetical protein